MATCASQSYKPWWTPQLCHNALGSCRSGEADALPVSKQASPGLSRLAVLWLRLGLDLYFCSSCFCIRAIAMLLDDRSVEKLLASLCSLLIVVWLDSRKHASRGTREEIKWGDKRRQGWETGGKTTCDEVRARRLNQGQKRETSPAKCGDKLLRQALGATSGKLRGDETRRCDKVPSSLVQAEGDRP